MKFLGKSFAVVAMALAVSTAAEARIQAIGDATADGSEFLFNLVNYSAQNSYTLDLGFTVEQFLANPSQSRTITINDSNFAQFAAAYQGGQNVTWGVNGGHGVLFEESDAAKFGFYTTAVGVPAVFDANTADISNTTGKWNNMVGSIQTQNANAINESTFRSVGQQGYTAPYGNDFQTALPFLAQGAIGAQLAFVHEKVSPLDFDTGELNVFPGKWTFSINGSTGTLSYVANAAPVPLPAAVWMFGAGLMGFLGLNRRKAVEA